MTNLLLILLSKFAMATGAMPTGVWSNPASDYYSPYVLTVDKSRKKLSVWKTDKHPYQLIKEYDSDQGQVDGDKLAENDKKTPEGIYFFEEQMDGHKVSFENYGVRIFTMNYPNVFDKRAGKTGYGIWLHAVPDTVPLSRGSRGCVVIRNDDILEVSNNITLNRTPILVYDKINMINTSQHMKGKEKFQTFLSAWQNAWQNKDIEAYMGHYAEDFYAMRMDKAKWQRHKENLNKNYQNISVSFSEPMIFEMDGNILIRSLQHYQSDTYEDYGEKFLYVQKRPEGYKIIAEEWKPVAQDVVLAELGNSRFLSNTRSVSSNDTRN